MEIRTRTRVVQELPARAQLQSQRVLLDNTGDELVLDKPLEGSHTLQANLRPLRGRPGAAQGSLQSGRITPVKSPRHYTSQDVRAFQSEIIKFTAPAGCPTQYMQQNRELQNYCLGGGGHLPWGSVAAGAPTGEQAGRAMTSCGV